MRLLLEATTLEALSAAAHRAARGKRQQAAVAGYLMDLEPRSLELQRCLRVHPGHACAWRPSPSIEFFIRDPKPRRISVLPFVDRVVHHALIGVAEPYLERYAIDASFACRPGKGAGHALRCAQKHARSTAWCWKADISSFFSSIPHPELMVLLRRRLKDGALCKRFELIVRAGSPARVGLPIGALTSQHLANLFLGRLDHFVKDSLGFKRYARYMDDWVAFGSRGELERLRTEVVEFLTHALKLELNPRSSGFYPCATGIPFLGARVFPGTILVAPVGWCRMRRRIRWVVRSVESQSITEEEGARRLNGLYGYLRQFNAQRLCASYLARLSGGSGIGLLRQIPGGPGRLLEQQPAERAGGQPQQGQPLQAERQPGLSSLELNVIPGPRKGPMQGQPDGARLRTVVQSIDVDPTGIQSRPMLRLGVTKQPKSGGGFHIRKGVAAGHFSVDHRTGLRSMPQISETPERDCHTRSEGEQDT